MITLAPYGSKALSQYRMTAYAADINRYITIDYAYLRNGESVRFKPFEGSNGTFNPVVLYGATDSEKEVPPFNHPLVNEDYKWIALDLRNYVKFEHDRTSYEIRNESEFRLAILRYALSSLWYVGKQSSLYGLKLPHFTFSAWLSDNLTSKFGLGPGDAIRLKVLAMIYYTRLFHNGIQDDELDLLIIRGKDDMLLADIIKDVYAEAGDFETIDGFCEACFKVTGNVRLQGLNYLVLTNTLASNWFGSNGQELVKLSLEHPPTWISLVYVALTQRSFKKNHITTLVERLSKRGKDVDFTKQVDSIVSDTMTGW